MSDREPAYLREIDRLLYKYDLQQHQHNSLLSKIVYLMLAMDRKITLLESPLER